MRYCTYCKVFNNEENKVEREDDIYELYDKHELIRHPFEEFEYRYACKVCGSIYTGIP
jgi:hypothetical protein